MTGVAAVRDVRRLITDIYISIMLLVFPLFTGFSGYGNITFSKYLFFVIITGLWFLALLSTSIFMKLPPPSPGIGQLAALCFAGICLVSFCLSPYSSESLIGAGRYEGLITQLLYVCIFLGVSLFGYPQPRHFFCLGLSLLICSLVGIFQLFNIDIFGLFMGSYSHYDAGYKYSSAFLGTMGNTNLLSAYYCLALPALFALPILTDKKRAYLSLIPLCPAIFVLIRAGVSGGFVALGLGALISLPLIISDTGRLRRALIASAPLLASAAAALAFTPEYDLVNFSWSFDFHGAPSILLLAAVVCSFVGFALRFAPFNPGKKTLRIILICVSVAIFFSGLTFIYFSPPAEGTLWELSEVLHGRINEKFGSSRILIWRECLKLFPEHPLLGSGPDTLALRADVSFSRYVEETGQTLRSGVDNAHNEYLSYLINIGLLGLAAYITLLILGARNWLRKLNKPLPCALGLACLCYCIQSFFALGLPLVSPLLWISLALLFTGIKNRIYEIM